MQNNIPMQRYPPNQGGIINAPSNVTFYGTRSTNGAHWNNKSSNQTITSVTLSVTKDSPFGDNLSQEL